jgi:predicted AAA+ superfamily ATPase
MTGTVSFMGTYVRRVIDNDLDELLPELPAVLLDGPKGVGKTATAEQRCATVRRLDIESERAIIEADPSLIGADEPPVLIDEWQRVPGVFDAVRRLVDRDPTGGRYLLTGSAPTTQTHSGAGRITTMRMRPLTLAERGVETPTVSLAKLLDGGAAVAGRTRLGVADYVAEIVMGGFPGMRHLSERARNMQLDSYVDRIIDHDLVEAGLAVRRPETVRAWLRSYAAAIATTTSWEKIRNAASADNDRPAKSTTQPYIELLTALRILDPVEAWSPSNNHLSALTSTPKHFLADPALAARMVRLSATQLLSGTGPGTGVPRDGVFVGGLFESLAALSVRTFAQSSDARVFHLRTDAGRHEIDFIVEGPKGILGLEVKLTGAVTDKDVRHLLWLREKLGEHCVDVAVLHTGPDAYRRRDGVAVIPLGLLGR